MSKIDEELIELSTFWGHFEELRLVLIKVVFVVLMATTILFIFHQPIFHILIRHFQTSFHESYETYEIKLHRVINRGSEKITFELPNSGILKYQSEGIENIANDHFQLPPQSYLEWEEAKSPNHLFLLGPIEGLTISLKISFWLGIASSSPFWLYLIFQFIVPGLYQKEKNLILPFVGLSFLFISLGLCFSYFITVPLANRYLFAFNEHLGVNIWSLANYIDYTFLLMISSAIAFELFVIAFFLVHFRFLKVQAMKDKRRYVILASFILGAFLTPPDILSQFLIAIPMIVLYECAILYAYILYSNAD